MMKIDDAIRIQKNLEVFHVNHVWTIIHQTKNENSKKSLEILQKTYETMAIFVN